MSDAGLTCSGKLFEFSKSLWGLVGPGSL